MKVRTIGVNIVDMKENVKSPREKTPYQYEASAKDVEKYSLSWDDY